MPRFNDVCRRNELFFSAGVKLSRWLKQRAAVPAHLAVGDSWQDHRLDIQ